MEDKAMLQFRYDIIMLTNKINLLHIVAGIPSDITTIAALRLLARCLEVGNSQLNGRKLGELNDDEIENTVKQIVELSKKELDFILADQR